MFVFPGNGHYGVSSLILVFEPLTILADSFWLSSFAVAALIFWVSFVKLSIQFQPGWLNWIAKLVHFQLGMLILLTPIQLFLFQGINIANFLANLWAGSIISFVTIPVIMVSHICLYWHGVQSLLFDIIDKSISLALWPLTYLERYGFATGNVPIMITALSWFIILCWQFGWFVHYNLLIRLLIYCLMLGLKPSDFAVWRLIMLDVGHGLAIIIEQQGKVLIYDTGTSWKKNSIADKTILPYLRYHRLIPEGVILSHNHVDHTGGVASLLLTYPGLMIRSNFDKNPFSLPSRCTLAMAGIIF
ncbi:MAG: ComEC/Rec2 family competence protein [Arsenophonus endosymbiont of Dermacentor nuttalli]